MENQAEAQSIETIQTVESTAPEMEDHGAESHEGGAEQGGAQLEQEEKFDPKEFRHLQAQVKDQLKRIGRVTASNYQYKEQLAAMEQELAKYRTASQQKEIDASKPDVSQFKTLQEYTEALTEWKIKQLRGDAAPKNPQQDGGLSSEDREWSAQAERDLTAQSNELRAGIPDYAQVMAETSDLLEKLPFAVQKTIVAASPHPMLALYALAKEGEMGRLFEARSAQELTGIMRKATEYAVKNIRSYVDPKLLQGIQGKPAPKPITTSRGNATAKSEDELSGKELLQRYRNRKR